MATGRDAGSSWKGEGLVILREGAVGIFEIRCLGAGDQQTVAGGFQGASATS